MMVTWVRGHFVNIHGTLQFDSAAPGQSTVEIEIDVSTLWSGDPQRDEHLLGADFLDVANHPKIVFKSTEVEQIGESEYRVIGELTLRGVTRETSLTSITSVNGQHRFGQMVLTQDRDNGLALK